MKNTSFLALPLLLLSAAPAFASLAEYARRDDSSAESILENDFGLTSVATGKTLTSLATALVSAQSSMNTRSDLSSAWEALYTAAPGTVVASITQNGLAYINPTAEPSWFSSLPGDVKKQIISEQSVLRSIETKILDITSSGPAPAAATAGGILGVAAAGVLGAIAML